MDQLQKLVRNRLRTQAPTGHPDAEVLSAFAESALPVAEREAVVEHLSACAPCRDIVFLAAPPASEQQQVFAVPKARPYFALRWGTLAACLMIGAMLLVSRRGDLQTASRSVSAKATSIPVAEKLAAQEKVPAELESMRDRKVAPRILPPPAPARGHAEPKQSIAEPSARLIFDDSGEINSRGSQFHARSAPPSPVTELPIEGRNVRELSKLAPAGGSGSWGGVGGNRAVASAVPSAPGASDRESSALKAENRPVSNQSAQSIVALAGTPANKDQLLSYGYVTGRILDLTGAVVPNAKVTLTGLLGEKTAVSDSAGKFSFNTLAAGTYQLKVDAAGFRKALSQVAVLSHQPATADFRLQPGAASETVSVEAAAAPERPSAVDGMVASDAETLNSLQAAEEEIAPAKAKKQKADKARGKSALGNLAAPQQFSVSAKGTVERSNDGGKTWIPVAVAQGGVFRAVESNGNEVWAAGNAGLLYHSLDGGQHWTHVIPVSNGEIIQADITQIQLSDPQHVVLRSATGQAWSSADSGKTWVAQ
jgi:hypothetical protein